MIQSERQFLTRSRLFLPLKGLLASVLLLGGKAAWAQDTSPPRALTIGGSAGVVSQYRFRGISWSNGHPAIQGELHATHESGFYGGAWASSLEGFGTVGRSNVEVDLYAGYKRQMGALTVDAGLLWYFFPGNDNTDFAEPYASISGQLGPARLKIGVAFAPKQDAASLGGRDNVYVYGDAELGIPGTALTLKSHIGHSNGGTLLSPDPDYFDWRVGADLQVKALTIGIAYVDTNIDSRAAAARAPGKNVAGATAVLSAKVSF